jgi:hypothetical protein
VHQADSTPGGASSARGFLRGLIGLAVEYVHMRYVGRWVRLHRHVRGLPGPEARLTIGALALTAVVVVALPVLAWVGVHLPAVSFETTHSIPEAALYLALLAFGVGLAYAIAGAAQGPGLLWLVVSAEYVFLVVAVGFSVDPRSPRERLAYLFLLPVLLPVVVGALTPGVRRWAQYGLLALVSSVALRWTPLDTDAASLIGLHRLHWYALWPPAMAALVALHHLLARRPWPSAGHRALLAAAGTLLFIAVVIGLARPAALAEQLDTSLELVLGTLSLLWFVLGGSFVEGAIGLAEFARKGLETVAPSRVLPWLIGVGWVGLVAWVVWRSPAGVHLPVRPASLVALAALLGLLAFTARSGRVSHDWLAGWFVASAAAVLAVRAYGTIDIRQIKDGAGALKEGARVLALAGFVYAITWEIVGEIWTVPLETRRLPRPSPLVLYLAGAVLVCGAALFGVAARLDVFQENIIVNEYGGALYLSIPLGLLAAAHTWHVLPEAALRHSVTAFYWGALLAVPAFLAREVLRGPATDAAVLLALALLATALRRHPGARAPRAAVAVAAASALGLVIGLAQPALVGVLSDLLNLAASLTHTARLETAAGAVLDLVQRAQLAPPSLLGYDVGAPVLAIAAALTGAWVDRLRGGEQERTSPARGTVESADS